MGKLSRCAVLLLVCFSAAVADDIRKITLKTNDIIYDPVSHKIYASVPSSAGVNGNSITVIDPWTGVVGPSIPVGSEPNKLALSDDGQYLYVGLDGAAAVRRLHIPTLTAGLQFVLGSDPSYGPFYVEDMEVLPGRADAVAVSRRSSGYFPQSQGVAVYDNGVQRPNVTPSNFDPHVIEFSSSAALLYGFDNQSSAGSFYRMSINASGMIFIDTTTGIVNGYPTDMEFDNGLICFSTGLVYDPEIKLLVGTFWGVSSPAIARPDSTVGRTFFLTGDEYSATRSLQVFDQATFLPVGSLNVSGVSGPASSLVRWGANGLAFRDDNSVLLIRTALVPQPAPRLVPADTDGDGFQEIFADLGSAGLWEWDGAWTSLSAMNPDSLVAADLDGDGVQEIVVDFGFSGLWTWDAGVWTQLAGANPDGLISADIDGDGAAELVVDFDGLGGWLWNAGAWTQLTGTNVDSMIAADVDGNGRDEVVADAGPLGLWIWSGGAWTQLSGLDPEGIIAAHRPTGDAIVGDFGPTGAWLWQSGAWTQLSGVNPDAMVAADTDLDGIGEVVVDFGPVGVWLWDGAWTQLSGKDAEGMIAADVDGNGAQDIISDFGPLGVWAWNGGWSQLSAVDPTAMAAANTDADLARELVVDFGRVGIWLFNGGAWSQIR